MSNLLHPRHFIGRVLVMAKKADVRLCQALVVEGEADMFAKGQRFDSAVVAAWAQGKLPIDKLELEGDEVPTPNRLKEDLAELWARHPDFKAVEDQIDAVGELIKVFNRMGLPVPLMLHLTTMRVASRSLYEKALAGAWLTMVMAKLLDFDRNDFDAAVRAALLRDVGMLYGDTEVVSPSSTVRLTPSQREEMQAHPTVGSDVVLRHGGSSLEKVAELVAQHHERLDGSGYPNQVQGLDLSPAARVIGLVDVVLAIRMRKNLTAGIELADVLSVLLMDRSGFDTVIYSRFVKLAKSVATGSSDDISIARQAMQLSLRSTFLAEQVMELEEKLRPRSIPRHLGPEVKERADRTFAVLKRSGIADREIAWWLKKVASGRDQATPDQLKEIELQQNEMQRQLERIESDLGSGPEVLTFRDVANN